MMLYDIVRRHAVCEWAFSRSSEADFVSSIAVLYAEVPVGIFAARAPLWHRLVWRLCKVNTGVS